MVYDRPSLYVPRSADMELARTACRLKDIHVFGSIYLCGLEPPVLKWDVHTRKICSALEIKVTSNSQHLQNVSKCHAFY